MGKSEKLGPALRKRRKHLGLTMQSVADDAGLSMGFISQVERGITQPSLGSPVSIGEVLQTSIGGWGAWDGRDGNPCIFSGFHGETCNTPAEISEARNGLFVERMELNTTPGGEGEYMGGRGLILEYRKRAKNGFLTAGYTRSKINPWFLEGGEEGPRNFVDVIKADGTAESYSFVSGLSLSTDDVVRVITSSGAGYGDPKKRDPEAIKTDIQNRLLTEEWAKEIYY